MVIFSSVLLIACSLFAAILPYRQPQKLSDQARPLASLSALSCLFVALSAIISLFVSSNLNEDQAVAIIFNNLANYLALPLLCAIVLSTFFKRFFTKATWGRISLVMLATFELCRRAEIGDIYSYSLAIGTSIAIAVCLFVWQKGSSKLLLINLATAISYSLAAVIFSKAVATQYQSIVLYQCFLGLALIGINYNLSIAIAKIELKASQ